MKYSEYLDDVKRAVDVIPPAEREQNKIALGSILLDSDNNFDANEFGRFLGETLDKMIISKGSNPTPSFKKELVGALLQIIESKISTSSSCSAKVGWSMIQNSVVAKGVLEFLHSFGA